MQITRTVHAHYATCRVNFNSIASSLSEFFSFFPAITLHSKFGSRKIVSVEKNKIYVEHRSVSVLKFSNDISKNINIY